MIKLNTHCAEVLTMK